MSKTLPKSTVKHALPTRKFTRKLGFIFVCMLTIILIITLELNQNWVFPLTFQSLITFPISITIDNPAKLKKNNIEIREIDSSAKKIPESQTQTPTFKLSSSQQGAVYNFKKTLQNSIPTMTYRMDPNIAKKSTFTKKYDIDLETTSQEQNWNNSLNIVMTDLFSGNFTVANSPITIDATSIQLHEYSSGATTTFPLLENAGAATAHHLIGVQAKELECKFPLLDPFDKSILKFVDHPKTQICKKTQPYLTFLDEHGAIIINQSEWNSYSAVGGGNLTCYWRDIDRAQGNNDSALAMSEFKLLSPEIHQDFTSDTAEVECHKASAGGGWKKIYQMLHPHPRNLATPMVDNGESQLSVWLFMLESVSLNMFRRQLPQTYDYLSSSMGAFVFRGYNKVADNSFPNIIPLLTGKRARNQQEGMADEFGGVNYTTVRFDDFPLIWKNFSREKGYKTAFIEDSPRMGLFSYQMKGFNDKPVDWSFRPYMLSREDNTGPSSWNCYANSAQYAQQLDVGERLIRKCHNKRCFIYDFFSQMSHDHCCEIERCDSIFAESFRKMHQQGLLNKTALFVMGDHGHRFASLRATQVGLLEERLPMLGILLPDWFLKMHKHIKKNLSLNQWRLTTPFDVHETLSDILNANFDGSQRPLSQRGLSHFYPLPLNRTCLSAGIPEHYCTCTQGAPIDVDDPIVANISHFIIDHLNQLLEPLAELCSTLSLNRTMRAEIFRLNQKIIHGVKNYMENESFNSQKHAIKESTLRSYVVLVEARPSGALFEGMTTFNADTQEMQITGDISRINKYGRQAACIKDLALEKFCFCK